MDGVSASIPGLDKFRFESDENRKSEMLGSASTEDDLPDSGPRPASLGSVGGADSLSGPEDLPQTVTQVRTYVHIFIHTYIHVCTCIHAFYCISFFTLLRAQALGFT
jgi:hypothetical protein